MQYSPYSANMNPYQTIYNNGGASAYQPTWGYTDLFGHALGTSPDLPAGYTRQQYNEERAMAAESMWRSPLLGFGTFATGTVASHVIFGSPLQNLSRLVGGVRGVAAFNAGFNGAPSFSDLWSARQDMLEAGMNWRAGLNGFTPAGSVAGLRQEFAAASNTWQTLNTQAQIARSASGTFWSRVGNFSRGISAFKESMSEAAASLISGGGRIAGSVASAGVQGFGGLAELGINQMTHGAMSPWLERQGTTLYNMATRSGGWMSNASSQLATLTAHEAELARATSALHSATTVQAATAARAQVAAAERNIAAITDTAHGFGGMLTKIRGGAANAVRSVGEILRSGRGISGVLGAGLSAGISGVSTLAAPILSNFLNPITSAEFYLMEQAIGYTTDAYQNYQTENEIKRNLMAKGNRILQYGFANGDRGLQGGFSIDQQDRLISKIRTMAAVGASQGDIFGFGANSLFGGHGRYSERMRELKSILSVGTDMGFFDMSRSMDDFEKKFEQTVKTVDKLSKMLKRTKGEIMTVMANVQNTEGLYGMSAINASVLKKDYAARLSGVDLTTAMQESAAGAQMGRQAGFSAAIGANLMSDSRIMMSNAIRSGDLSREDIFRLGGEQGVVTNIQQGYLNAMNDPVLKAELAMGMVRDPVTGKMRFDDARLRKLATASDAELREMSRERYAFVNTTSYSNIRHASFKGGKMYDAMRYLKTALASGDVSQEQYNMAIAGTVRQKLLAYHINETSPQYQESLRLELENLTGDPTTANIIAKQMLGGYAGMQAHNNMVVAADRFREGYEKSGMGFGMLGSAGFSPTHSWLGFGLTAGATALTTAAGAYIGGHFGMAGKGALIGSQIGIWTGKYAAAGLTVAAHELLGADSSVATYLRNSARESAIAQGINPNYVDRYLLGESAADRIASMGVEKFNRAIDYVTKKSPLNTLTLNQNENWLTGINSVNTEDLKKYNKIFKEVNPLLTGNKKATLAGLLDLSMNTLVKEFGLSEDAAEKIRELSDRMAKGDGVVDLSNMAPDDMKKFAKLIASAQASLPSERAYEDIARLYRHSKLTKSDFENEEEYRANTFNLESLDSNYNKNINGFLSTFALKGVSLKGGFGATVNTYGDAAFHIAMQDTAGFSSLKKDVKQRNIEKWRKGFQWLGWLHHNTFGTWDNEVSEELRIISDTWSSKFGADELDLMINALENGNLRGVLKGKGLLNDFKEDTVLTKALRNYIENGSKDTEQLDIIKGMLNHAKNKQGLEEVKTYVNKVASAFKISISGKTGEDFKGEHKLSEILENFSDQNWMQKLTEEDWGVLQSDSDLKKYTSNIAASLSAPEKIKEATLNFLKQGSADLLAKHYDEMHSAGTSNESNAAQISDRAMQNYKDATRMLKEVVTRLGF